MSEHSEARERSEQCGAIERESGASELANGRASGQVLQSVFLVVLAHNAVEKKRERNQEGLLHSYCKERRDKEAAELRVGQK